MLIVRQQASRGDEERGSIMTPTSDREYEYKPPWTAILMRVLLFGGCAVLFATEAQLNRGLLIHGIIPLSPRSRHILVDYHCP